MGPEDPSRERALPTARACVLLALLPLILFSETLFGGKVLSQSDALLEFQPWKSVAPEGYRPENPLLLDQALLMRPWLDYAAERVRAGELPLWNPYNFCGQPITAAVTGATYWPLHWIYYAFPGPAFHAWAAALKVYLAGLFTFLFLRRIGVSGAAGIVGAAAFMLSGFMIAWLNHPHTNAALCLPLLLWQIERLAARPGARSIATLGLSVALPLVGGHLQTAAHVLLGAGAYALFRTRVALVGPALGLRGLASFAAAGVLGCLVAAPQLVPFVEYYLASMGKDLLAAFDTTSPFPRGQALRLLVAPDALGGPHTGDYRGPVGFNLNYNELIGGFVGRLPLVLAGVQLLRLRRARASWFLLALAAVGALVAYRVFPFYEGARAVPLLRSTKLSRLSLFLAFGTAALAAQGLDRLLARLSVRGAALAALVAFTVAAADLVQWGYGYNPAIDRALIAPESPTTRFLEEEREPYRVLGVDNTILLPNANLFHRIPMVSGYDSIEYRPMAELVALLSRNPLQGFDEILGAGEGPLPRAGFIKEIRAFDRVEGVPIASLLGAKYFLSETELPAPFVLVRDGDVRIYENPSALPRAFVASGWRVIEDADERLDYLGSGELDPRLAVLERAPSRPGFAPRAEPEPAPAGTATVVTYEPRLVRIEARMERPGLVVVADAWDPGWRARRGGEELPIERVDHALRGLFLSAGTHEIVLSYEPASTSWGLVAAASALAGAVLAWVWPRRLQRPGGARPVVR